MISKVRLKQNLGSWDASDQLTCDICGKSQIMLLKASWFSLNFISFFSFWPLVISHCGAVTSAGAKEGQIPNVLHAQLREIDRYEQDKSSIGGQTELVIHRHIYSTTSVIKLYSSSFLCCHGAFLNVPNILFLSVFGFSIGLSSVHVTALMMDLVAWRTGNDEGVSHFTEPHLDALPWLWDSQCILSPSAHPALSFLPSKIFSWAQERIAWLGWM